VYSSKDSPDQVLFFLRNELQVSPELRDFIISQLFKALNLGMIKEYLERVGGDDWCSASEKG
jgi:hypothetical protein